MAESKGATVSFGSASSFAVLGASGITNTGTTTLSGDVGVSPSNAVTGFSSVTISNGALELATAKANSAIADALTGYNTLAGLTTTLDLSGQDLGSRTLTPGVYNFSSSAQLTGTLTLDGQGMADPLFVFKIGSTLTTASGANIVLINGAVSSNIFYQVVSSATIGSGSAIKGTVIALAASTLGAGATVEGRVIALTESVTLINNTIAVPEPSSSVMILAGTGAILLRRKRTDRMALV